MNMINILLMINMINTINILLLMTHRSLIDEITCLEFPHHQRRVLTDEYIFSWTRNNHPIWN